MVRFARSDTGNICHTGTIPAFYLNAVRIRPFTFKLMRTLVYRPSSAPFRASTPPLWAFIPPFWAFTPPLCASPISFWASKVPKFWLKCGSGSATLKRSANKYSLSRQNFCYCFWNSYGSRLKNLCWFISFIFCAMYRIRLLGDMRMCTDFDFYYV